MAKNDFILLLVMVGLVVAGLIGFWWLGATPAGQAAEATTVPSFTSTSAPTEAAAVLTSEPSPTSVPPTAAPTSTSTAVPPTPSPTVTVPPTPSSTSTPAPTVTPTPPPTLTDTSTPLPTDTSTATATVPSTPTPSPSAVVIATTVPPNSPTPVTKATPAQLIGIVNGSRVNVRSQPDISSSVVVSLPQGTEVSIIDQSSANGWWQVRTLNGQEGWIAATLIDQQEPADVAKTSPPTATPTPRACAPMPFALDRQAKGVLKPGAVCVHSYTSPSQGTAIFLLFRPNVNGANDPNIMQFSVSPEGDAVLGKGTHRNLGDGIGRLEWQGGKPNARHFIEIHNYSKGETVEYCLVARDVKEWVCN
ncbi:MAG: SH3 domain-containing protein [Anaerolineae bacterium]|nr:SH3 domain-containing protein [Anaerolineae bacterium]